MTTSFSPVQLERFRREAKKLSRTLAISHSEALDRIAARYSFQNWSLLAKHSAIVAPPAPARKPDNNKPLPVAMRYYLHGDVAVDDPTRCYCARCDLFVELTHFDGTGHHGDGEDGARYLNSLSIHNELPPLRRAARGRPDDAANVLAVRATRERADGEAARSPFHRWLEGQRHRNDIVGDLASDILGDRSFPVELRTRRQIEEHLSWHGDHIVRAIRQAWREFSASTDTPAS